MDVDRDGKIGYKVNIKTKNTVFFINYDMKDFQKMVNPPKPPERPKPTKAEFRNQFQNKCEDVSKDLTSLQASFNIQEEPHQEAPSFDKDSCSVDVNASFSDPLLSTNLSA